MAYPDQVRTDIERWRANGLIDDATATALLADVVAHARRRISLGSIIAMLAATLFAAAVLLFIAANWELIARPVRVAMIFGLILAGYVGGAVLKERGHPAFGEAAWFIAAVAFGGGIALIGQMYHISGDETQAILVWCAGTALAATLLRSAPLTSGAVLLLAIWLFMAAEGVSRNQAFPHIFLLYAAVLWAVSVWTQARPARQLILLSLIAYGVLSFLHVEDRSVLVGLSMVSAGLLLVSVFARRETERLTQIADSMQTIALLGFLVGTIGLQFDLSGSAFIVMAVIIFGGVIAAIMLAGRQNRALRWLAYAGFGFELCYVYVELIGSMMGTAGFFLAAAVILALLAWVILRVERGFVTEKAA